MNKTGIVLILIIIIILIIVGIQSYKFVKTKDVTQENTDKITYTINNNMDNYNSDYSERGVYYTTFNRVDAPHIYTIAMGTQNTGGYSINIEEVNVDGNKNVEVIVKEIKSQFDEMVTSALTYPICMITLDKYPNSIVVKNTDGEIFKNINF